MPRNGGVSFIRTWSPSPETGDGRGIPVSVSEADSLVLLSRPPLAFSTGGERLPRHRRGGRPLQVGSSNMASVILSSRPLRCQSRTLAVCPIFFNGTCRRGSQADMVPVRNQLQGRPLCPQPLLRRTHPYDGGAVWLKNPKSSKSCSMTR